MAEESKVAHKHISYFNPDVLLEQSHQDFSAKMKSFSAGTEYTNFNEFSGGAVLCLSVVFEMLVNYHSAFWLAKSSVVVHQSNIKFLHIFVKVV